MNAMKKNIRYFALALGILAFLPVLYYVPEVDRLSRDPLSSEETLKDLLHMMTVFSIISGVGFVYFLATMKFPNRREILARRMEAEQKKEAEAAKAGAPEPQRDSASES